MAYDLSRLHVLVVDDNIHICRLVSDVLEAFDIARVDTAKEGVEGFWMFAGNKPDIVITDMDMPGGDGLELIRRIRQDEESPNPTVPIIMMSGYSERERVLAVRDIGVTEFLCKPFSVGMIYDRLIAVIARPRPFVRRSGYFGPDRRRSINDFRGEERRSSEGGATKQVAAEAGG